MSRWHLPGADCSRCFNAFFLNALYDSWVRSLGRESMGVSWSLTQKTGEGLPHAVLRDELGPRGLFDL
jgi:hypothetical protein